MPEPRESPGIVRSGHGPGPDRPATERPVWTKDCKPVKARADPSQLNLMLIQITARSGKGLLALAGLVFSAWTSLDQSRPVRARAWSVIANLLQTGPDQGRASASEGCPVTTWTIQGYFEA